MSLITLRFFLHFGLFPLEVYLILHFSFSAYHFVDIYITYISGWLILFYEVPFGGEYLVFI